MAAPPSEETQACVAASTQGQIDRDEGRLLAAREQLLSCTRELCPAIVRRSCADWLTELAERIPSVVVRVQEAGKDELPEVSVTLDDRPLALDGRPLPLDPGTHVLAVQAREGSADQRSFLVAEREQGRLIVVELPARSPPHTEAPHVAPKPIPKPIASLSVPVMSWVLGGLGVIGVGAFTVLRVDVANELHALERTCSPHCSADQRDNAKREALVADISLGVGIAALAGGIAWTVGSWLTHTNEANALSVSLVPTPEGGFAALMGRF